MRTILIVAAAVFVATGLSVHLAKAQVDQMEEGDISACKLNGLPEQVCKQMVPKNAVRSEAVEEIVFTGTCMAELDRMPVPCEDEVMHVKSGGS